MRLKIRAFPTPILVKSSRMELGKALAQEPVFASLLCGHHLCPHLSITLASKPHPGEKSIVHEPPAAGPAREQMVQEQPRPPEGKSQGLAFVGRLRGGIKHSPCQAVWPAAWMLHSGLVGPTPGQGTPAVLCTHRSAAT